MRFSDGSMSTWAITRSRSRLRSAACMSCTWPSVSLTVIISFAYASSSVNDALSSPCMRIINPRYVGKAAPRSANASRKIGVRSVHCVTRCCCCDGISESGDVPMESWDGSTGSPFSLSAASKSASIFCKNCGRGRLEHCRSISSLPALARLGDCAVTSTAARPELSRCKKLKSLSPKEVVTRAEDFEGQESNVAEGHGAAGASKSPLALMMEATESLRSCEEDLPAMRFLYAASAAASRVSS